MTLLRFMLVFGVGLVAGACDDGDGSTTDAAPGADGATSDAQGGDGAAGDATVDDGAVDAGPADGGPDPDAGAEADGGPVAVNVREALRQACPNGGNPSNPPNSLARGDDLHRLTLEDPTAICNDGSPAVLYVRRAPTPAAERRWVFHVQGGGGCSTYDDCRQRWCGQQGIYDASKMSSRYAPEAIGGKGILRPGPDNDFDAANHVFIYYCSSDSWVGQRDDVLLESATRPGQRFSMHVRGHSILAAMVARLRAGDATSDDGAESLPDLDEAATVLWTGVSAGASGAAHNIDWFAQQLGADTQVYGVFDAGFRPDVADISDPELAATQTAALERRYAGWFAAIDAFADASCRAWHGDDPGVCVDTTHTKLNHITTPWFQRADLTDGPGSGSYTDSGATVEAFAFDSRATLARFPSVGQDGEEADAIDFTPGVYGPNCGQHVGITNNLWFHETTVEDEDGAPVTFHDALRTWLTGASVEIVDTQPASRSMCGAVDDGRS